MYRRAANRRITNNSFSERKLFFVFSLNNNWIFSSVCRETDSYGLLLIRFTSSYQKFSRANKVDGQVASATKEIPFAQRSGRVVDANVHDVFLLEKSVEVKVFALVADRTCVPSRKTIELSFSSQRGDARLRREPPALSSVPWKSDRDTRKGSVLSS